jgi:hypothetical protein
MEIRIEDNRVHLFRFFGGDYANENNTTRSLMVALTRSQWSPVILRGFFDILVKKLRDGPGETAGTAREILGVWPASLQVRMQQGVAGTDFLPAEMEIDSAILLQIEPDSENEAIDASTKQAEPSGIIDACLIVTSPEDKTVAIVIESKLYGQAGEDQMCRYAAAIRPPAIRLQLTWEEIYSLLEHLPKEADFDSILRDYRDYLNERPGLVGFTGFRPEDFTDARRLDTQLYRLNQKISRQGVPGRIFRRDVARVRGGCDYGLYLDAPEAQGNLGIASFEPASVSCKLAVGWADYGQTTRALANSEDADVQECLSALANEGTLTIDLYFCCVVNRTVHGFAYRRFPAEGNTVIGSWRSACSLAREYHRKTEATDAVLDEILGRDGVEGVEPGLATLRSMQRREMVKGCFAIVVKRHERELVRLNARQQFEKFQGDLKLLADLLAPLSSRPA